MTVADPIGVTTHADAMAVLAERDVVRGFADGTLRPEQPVTLGQAASMLAAAAGIVEVGVDGASGAGDDERGVHAASVEALGAAGALAGVDTGDGLDANAELSRAGSPRMLGGLLSLTAADSA